uniref:VP12 n=1 Tax=Callinectes sapidus reovirus 2 TaxID=2789658 RepID=A0A8K1HQL1_9REOV|nr:VP12 [Callinectes sapidus reovirus 2]
MASMVARRIVAAIDGLSLSVIIMFDYLIQDEVLPELASKYVTSGVAALVTVLHLVIYAAGFDIKLAREQMKRDELNNDSAPTDMSAVRYAPATAPTLESLHIPGYMREYVKLHPTVNMSEPVKPIVNAVQQDFINTTGIKDKVINTARSTAAAAVKPLRSSKAVVNDR